MAARPLWATVPLEMASLACSVASLVLEIAAWASLLATLAVKIAALAFSVVTLALKVAALAWSVGAQIACSAATVVFKIGFKEAVGKNCAL